VHHHRTNASSVHAPHVAAARWRRSQVQGDQVIAGDVHYYAWLDIPQVVAPLGWEAEDIMQGR